MHSNVDCCTIYVLVELGIESNLEPTTKSVVEDNPVQVSILQTEYFAS